MSPSSAARIEANRANALLSTGPRTEEGKLASSSNSTTTGLTAAKIFVRPEEQAEFDAFEAGLRTDLKPDRPHSALSTGSSTPPFRRLVKLIKPRLRRVPNLVSASSFGSQAQKVMAGQGCRVDAISMIGTGASFCTWSGWSSSKGVRYSS